MTNHFPGHHPRPVSVDTLDGIEAVALAIQHLHEAMAATSPTHRFLATTMMADELSAIYAMVYADQQQFAAQGLRDMSIEATTRPATDAEIREWRERSR